MALTPRLTNLFQGENIRWSEAGDQYESNTFRIKDLSEVIESVYHLGYLNGQDSNGYNLKATATWDLQLKLELLNRNLVPTVPLNPYTSTPVRSPRSSLQTLSHPFAVPSNIEEEIITPNGRKAIIREDINRRPTTIIKKTTTPTEIITTTTTTSPRRKTVPNQTFIEETISPNGDIITKTTRTQSRTDIDDLILPNENIITKNTRTGKTVNFINPFTNLRPQPPLDDVFDDDYVSDALIFDRKQKCYERCRSQCDE